MKGNVFMTRSLNLGMRILCLALCLVCLASLVRPVAAEETTAQEQTQQQTLTTVVHLRANANSTPIGQMENGTVVTVLKEQKKFYKVDCYDMVGYIAKTQIVHSEDGQYYVNCDPESSETQVLTYTDHADALALRHSLMALADQQIGSRYVTGGIRPGSFDCSGLMYYLYGQHDIKLHRTAAQQMQDGIVVPKESMQVGDLIFFYEPGRTYPASHVGIYVGNNQMIHSGSKGVVLSDLDVDYYVKYFLCARRIVNTNTVQLEPVVTASVTGGILSSNSISGRTVN